MTELYDDHAWLYDLAFAWVAEEETDWLVGLLGEGCTSVLDPGCGPGRHLVALARRGLEVVGIDIAPAMVALARANLAQSGLAGQVVEADMTGFDLGRTFDGAICPINTLMHLTPADLARHLACIAGHLAPGGRYLVQLGVNDPTGAPGSTSFWEAEGDDGTRVEVTWTVEEVDLERQVERQRSRFAVVAGPRAGLVVAEEHRMTAWPAAALDRLFAVSPLERVELRDGDLPGYPQVDPAWAHGGRLWHVLEHRR